MRHRTAGLTRMERNHLSNMNPTLCQQLEASLQMQGGPPVAAVWLQALLTTEQPEYVVGELILCPGAAWTLAKCQLLEKRTGPDSNPGRYSCCCLPATAFMPLGCGCRRDGIGRIGFAACPRCSVCTRCHKLCRAFGRGDNMCSCRMAGLDGKGFLH